MFPIQLGLKASCDLEKMESRLKYHPDVFEFFTSLKMVFQNYFHLASLNSTSC